MDPSVPRPTRWLLALAATLMLGFTQAQFEGVSLNILTLNNEGPRASDALGFQILECQRTLGMAPYSRSLLSASDPWTQLATIHTGRMQEPDIIRTWTASTAQWGPGGLFLDLTDMLTAEEWAAFVPGALDAVTYQGRRYGIPSTLSIRHFYYNTAMFEEAGLDPSQPPRTWEAFVAAAIRTTDPSIGRYAVNHNYGSNASLVATFQDHIVLTGGRFVDTDGNLTINDAAAVDALARIVELNRLGVVDPASFGTHAARQERWLQGHNAMMWGFEADWTRSNDPAVSSIVGDVAVGLIPGIVEQSGAVSSSRGFAISAHSRNPNAALALLTCIMSEERQKAMARHVGSNPARRDVLDDAEVQAARSPMAAAAAEQSRYPTSSFAAPYQAEFTAILGPHLLSAIQGEVTPQEALDAAAVELAAMIAEF